AELRMYQQALFTLWGFGLGIVMLLEVVSGTQLSGVKNQVVLALTAAAMLLLGVYCARNTVGDYMLAHDVVEGTVDGLITSSRPPNTYQVIIDHKPYNITFDLMSELNRGEYVYVEVGIASNTVLSVRHQ